MSKQFGKQRNSQQKIAGVETWSPGDFAETNLLLKLPKPPRRESQQPFMTTQYEQLESSNIDPSQSMNQIKKQKLHRRRTSQMPRPEQILQSQDKDSESHFYNPQYKSYNVTPKMKRNQNQSDSFKEIQERFREIESIMGSQNENLRHQKDYLIRTIYKMQIRQKQYKNQIIQLQQNTVDLQEQNKILRQKYEKARDFIANGIGKIQQVITKQSQNNDLGNNSSSNTAHHSNQSSVNVSQQIQQLNDKFDALMYEYQKTRQPQIRKNCMEIAKQLRKLRKIQQKSDNKNKI